MFLNPRCLSVSPGCSTCPSAVGWGVPISSLSGSGCLRVPPCPCRADLGSALYTCAAVLFPSLPICVPQVCCPCAAVPQRGTGPPGRPPAPCSPPASRSPRVVPSATTRSRWSWTRAQVRRVAPRWCHPRATGTVGHRQGPSHPPLSHGSVALGMENHQSPRCSSCSCLGTSGRSVWGLESQQLWALQKVCATGKSWLLMSPASAVSSV